MEAQQSQSQYPPLPPNTKRYKLVWRVLLISNLALGAYMFVRAKKKNINIERSKGAKRGGVHGKAEVEVLSPTTTTSVNEEPLLSSAVVEPVNVRQPIPEDQQRELFKWMLEEKRKFKPKDPEEKKRIDEEKDILKQFIRAKSIPNL